MAAEETNGNETTKDDHEAGDLAKTGNPSPEPEALIDDTGGPVNNYNHPGYTGTKST